MSAPGAHPALACKEVILLISPESLGSHQVAREIEAAEHYGNEPGDGGVAPDVDPVSYSRGWSAR